MRFPQESRASARPTSGERCWTDLKTTVANCEHSEIYCKRPRNTATEGTPNTHTTRLDRLLTAMDVSDHRSTSRTRSLRRSGGKRYTLSSGEVVGVQRSERESPSELLSEGNPNPTSGHLSRDSKTIRANTRRPKAPSDSKVKTEDAKRAEVKVPFRPLDT